MSHLTCTSLGVSITMQAGTAYLGSQTALVPREPAIADLLFSSDTARLPQRQEPEYSTEGVDIGASAEPKHQH